MAQRAEVGEASVEARLARLEGAVAQMDKRIGDLRDDLNRRFEEFREETSKRLERMEAEIREVRGRFWWVIGILVTMWVSIIIAILFRG